MASAVLTQYAPSAQHVVPVLDLKHGDLVARTTQSGELGQARVVLRNGKGMALAFPKRILRHFGTDEVWQHVDSAADFTRYANDDGSVYVIGHVTPPESDTKPAATKTKSSPKATKPAAATQADDTTQATAKPSRNGMTKASAADALEAIAEAVCAQGEALRMVAAALR